MSTLNIAQNPVIFSFGAGVQSTAILLLIKYEPERVISAMGKLPDWIIFADTGAENQEALDNLERCKTLLPILRVKNWARNAETRPTDVPVFFGNNQANMQRQCTPEWKIKPIMKASKKLYPKNNFKQPVTLWLGISTDEAQRMKESWVQYVKHQYPLITLELSRFDCQQILKKYNWEAVKSSCYMCPFQSKRWLENKEIDKAIEFEERLQKESKYKETPYLHPSGLPLREVVERDKKQFSLFENWDFLNECEGHCGV